jgi:hypothetical protein
MRKATQSAEALLDAWQQSLFGNERQAIEEYRAIHVQYDSRRVLDLNKTIRMVDH